MDSDMKKALIDLFLCLALLALIGAACVETETDSKITSFASETMIPAYEKETPFVENLLTETPAFP
jgi:hypothetical protein